MAIWKKLMSFIWTPLWWLHPTRITEISKLMTTPSSDSCWWFSLMVLPLVTTSNDCLRWLHLTSYVLWWSFPSDSSYHLKTFNKNKTIQPAPSSNYLQWLPLVTTFNQLSSLVLPLEIPAHLKTRIKEQSKGTSSLWWLTTSGDCLRWLPPMTTSGDYILPAMSFGDLSLVIPSIIENIQQE